MANFPSPVERPSNAGNPKNAIAIPASAYVNIRNGPGTQFRDIGDIHRNTLIAYYPSSRTPDGWVWVEQFGVAGWVSTGVITFEDVAIRTPQPPPPATPYDNKVAVWHWRGDSIAENSIDAFIQTLKRNAPHVTSVFVKTSDCTPTTGAQWMGYWDSKRNLAIDGVASIDRWVTALNAAGMDFHAWCVPRGLNLVAETNLIIQACLRAGVKSMILDVEPYAGFWEGGRDLIRPFMTRIRKSIPGSFHIGMSIDPRPHHFASIYPEEWFPFINSVHPQSYWQTFQRTPDAVLDETFRVWGGYGRPVIPALQGDASTSSIREAHTIATQRHKARGLSWWRHGVIGPNEFQALNQPVIVTTPPTEPPTGDYYIDEQVVRPLDSDFSLWSHTGQPEVSHYQGVWGWIVYWKKTEAQASKISARWSPKLKLSGTYEISTFVSSRHSSTANARYKIHGVKGHSGELTVSLDQSKQRSQWVKLGVFDFDKDTINAGVVFLNDLTGENDKEIVFDAIRWRCIASNQDGVFIADGYDMPVGTAAERASSAVWAGKWIDASPFGKLYFIGSPNEAYHTGADLNLPGDADAHAPVYAAASGVVTFAARLPVWGNVIIIKHDPLYVGGVSMYGRYAHVEEMIVKVGQRVKRGEQISRVGNAYGVYAYHLHFDLSPTSILEQQPSHWPGKNLKALQANYVDPKAYILAHRPRR